MERRSWARWTALLAALFCASGAVCVNAQVSASGVRSLSLRKDGAIFETFQRHLTDYDVLDADAPEAGSPEEALAPTPVGDAGTREAAAADEDESFWDDFLDFDNPITITLVVIACLGAILCSGLGCACCALCCGAPAKKKPGKQNSMASKPPSKDGSVSKKTGGRSHALEVAEKPGSSGTIVTLAPLKTEDTYATLTADSSTAATTTFADVRDNEASSPKDESRPTYPWEAPPGHASATTAAAAAPASPRRTPAAAPAGHLAPLPEDTTVVPTDTGSDSSDSAPAEPKDPVLKTNLPPPSTPSSRSLSGDLREGGSWDANNVPHAIDPMTSNSYIQDTTPANETEREPWQAPARVKFPRPGTSGEAPVTARRELRPSMDVDMTIMASPKGESTVEETKEQPETQVPHYRPSLPSDSFASVPSDLSEECSKSSNPDNNMVPGYLPAKGEKPPGSVQSAPAGDDAYYHENNQRSVL